VKTFNKRLLLLVLCVFMAFGIAACGGSKEPAQGEKENQKLRVALMMDSSITDGGWSQSVYEGLLMAKEEFDIEIAYTDMIGPAEQEAIMRNYAQNYDVIMANGYPFEDVIHRVSQEFPNKMFVGIEVPTAGPNLMTARIERGETGYVQGTIAARMTKSNKIGYISAFQAPHTDKELEIMKERIAELNPAAEVIPVYTGDWADVNLAKQAATSLADQGVDIFTSSFHPGNMAAIQEAKERGGIYVIGMQVECYDLGPDVVLTSTLTNTSIVVRNAIKDIIDGNYRPGTSATYGYKEGANSLGKFGENMPEELIAELEQLVEDIKAGRIDINTDVPGYD